VAARGHPPAPAPLGMAPHRWLPEAPLRHQCCALGGSPTGSASPGGLDLSCRFHYLQSSGDAGAATPRQDVLIGSGRTDRVEVRGRGERAGHCGPLLTGKVGTQDSQRTHDDGCGPERLNPDQLAMVDEFHIGGRKATVELLDQLDLRPALRVLDAGGTARYLARRDGVEVTGVDLTAEYVEVATSLTLRAGLAELVQFRQASASTLPFSDGSFDRVCILHVGMNIADKAALFAEIRRVELWPGPKRRLYVHGMQVTRVTGF
jgi:hypothetical protein